MGIFYEDVSCPRRTFMDVFEIRRDRLRQLLSDSKLTRDEFCLKAGISYVQYGHYAGQNPTKRLGDVVARRIEENLALAKGYMDVQDLPVEDAKHKDGAGYLLTPLSLWDDDTPLDSDEVEIPFYKEVLFAAGGGSSQVLEVPGGKVRFSKYTLKSCGVDPKNAAGGVATGDSMEDKIADGAAIGIDKSRTQIKDGKIYAVDHNGMFRVKYLHKLPEGGIRLRSHNKAYEDEDLTAEQFKNSLRILGWVFWWSTVDRW